MGRSGLTDLGSAATHAHLWALPDGTGLHAPLGELAVEEGTGSLCCHLCGRWFVSLGSHVRAHGHTADSYRETMGLCRSTALTAAALSVAIAGRTTAQYRHDPELWHRLADGRAARGGGSAPQVAGYSQEPAQRVRRRQEALAAGRQAVAARRERRLAARLEHLGATGLHDYLRTAYAAGASLESLAGETGLGVKGCAGRSRTPTSRCAAPVATPLRANAPARSAPTRSPPTGWAPGTWWPGSPNGALPAGP